MPRIDPAKAKQVFDTVGDRLGKVMDEDGRLKLADIKLNDNQKSDIKEDLINAGLKLSAQNPAFQSASPEEQSRQLVEEIKTKPEAYTKAHRALNDMSASANGLAKMTYGGRDGIKAELLKGAEESIAAELAKPEIRKDLSTQNVASSQAVATPDGRMAKALQTYGKDPAILNNAGNIMASFVNEGRSAPNGVTEAINLRSVPTVTTANRQV